jgi:hypothetical protein
METKVKNGKTAVNGQNKGVNVNSGEKSTDFVNGNPINKETVKQPEPEKPKKEVKTEPAQAEQAKAETAQTPAEPSKKELKEHFAVQSFRNLEQTVSLITALGNKIKQREKYKFNIETLNAFKINQVEEDEDTGNTSYQRCELTITDDQGNEYVTKNPLVIAATVEFMSDRFSERLAEIEASIVIPA